MELAVRRALILALGTALSLAPLAYVTGAAVAQTKAPAGAYKTPRNYLLVPELPRNAMGKVTKNEVKNLF
jgi:acyl-coenzyme A synthetase/AMP-(fatty) acid ligase